MSYPSNMKGTFRNAWMFRIRNIMLSEFMLFHIKFSESHLICNKQILKSFCFDSKYRLASNILRQSKKKKNSYVSIITKNHMYNVHILMYTLIKMKQETDYKSKIFFPAKFMYMQYTYIPNKNEWIIENHIHMYIVQLFNKLFSTFYQ